MDNRGSVTVEATFVMVITIMVVFSVIILSMILQSRVCALALSRLEIEEDYGNFIISGQTMDVKRSSIDKEEELIWPGKGLSYEEEITKTVWNAPKLLRIRRMIGEVTD